MNAPYSPSKPFTWSYSQLKNFETCERRNQQIDRLKNFKEDSDALRWGNQVHDKLAASIGKGLPLPLTMRQFQPYVDTMLKHGQTAKLDVERKLAFNRNFEKTGYFDSDVWFRGVVDVSLLAAPKAALFDWKTGNIQDDGVQLGLFASMVFIHHAEIDEINTAYVWLKDNATTKEVWKRSDMANLWAALLPRVKRMELAYTTDKYLPNPTGLCRKYCPVTSCEYHGRGTY